MTGVNKFAEIQDICHDGRRMHRQPPESQVSASVSLKEQGMAASLLAWGAPLHPIKVEHSFAPVVRLRYGVDEMVRSGRSHLVPVSVYELYCVSEIAK